MTNQAARDDERREQSDAPGDDRAEPGAGLGPPTAVESLVGALLEAGPEVAEHVVKAAQELLLAVQAIVDAADRAVQEQQSLRTQRPEPDDGRAASDDSVRHLRPE